MGRQGGQGGQGGSYSCARELCLVAEVELAARRGPKVIRDTLENRNQPPVLVKRPELH